MHRTHHNGETRDAIRVPKRKNRARFAPRTTGSRFEKEPLFARKHAKTRKNKKTRGGLREISLLVKNERNDGGLHDIAGKRLYMYGRAIQYAGLSERRRRTCLPMARNWYVAKQRPPILDGENVGWVKQTDALVELRSQQVGLLSQWRRTTVDRFAQPHQKFVRP